MPATPIINARTNGSGLLDPSNFIFCAGMNQPPYCRSEMISAQFVVPTRKKILKKGEKKLVKTSGLRLEGNFERQMPSFRRSKKIQKSEKKACQGLINLITVLKPNQTNGETNDTKRTKNA